MREVAEITNGKEPRIIVLSAVSGTTNKLVSFNKHLKNEDIAKANEAIISFIKEYDIFVDELLPSPKYNAKAKEVINNHLEILRSFIGQPFSDNVDKIVLAQGELISTKLFALYNESLGREAVLLDALDFMRTNENGEPDMSKIKNALKLTLSKSNSQKYFITQGYICRNQDGKVSNLKRGGSDYTATIIGAAVEASEIQIWTDIDGMHNNDPRIVEGTFPVRKLSYREAAELAYFGAKILHPTCVLPAEDSGVPIRLKNTFKPDAPGTLISKEASGNDITAIAAKDGITSIRIRSGRMVNAYGFLRRVFEIFENYKTSIDMITTSEVSVSLTIDNPIHLDKIVEEIGVFGVITTYQDQTIICIVGDQLKKKHGFTSRVLQAIDDIPVRMVSYGGSTNNISVLVDTTNKKLALQSLQYHLFSQPVEAI